jgi:dolichyl-diphosphooligosaccharide--protein glycosyltransferase
LAQNETAAQTALDDRMGPNDETRYTMVDWQMATGKFNAPIRFTDASISDFKKIGFDRTGSEFRRTTLYKKQGYYQSQMIRLYAFHGSATDPAPVVLNNDQIPVSTGDGRQTTVTVRNSSRPFIQLPNMRAARAYVADNPEDQIGGIGQFVNERVAALEHHRLVHATEQRANVLRTPMSAVKTFEKVPGAEVVGNAPPDTEVTAAVDMKIPTTNKTFSYRQYATTDENGDFSMTLPYSTTGYDNFGPENGYTNVSVRADGKYRFRTTGDTGPLYTDDNITVTESQVLGVNEDPVRVQLTETQPQQVSRQSIQAAG